MYIKRSARDRRCAVNDLEHFAEGGAERRTYGAERRAFERDNEILVKPPRRTLFQLFR